MPYLRSSVFTRVVRKLTYLIVATGLTVGLVAAAASADSLVYVKSGVVYVANADGSQARPITAAGNDWAWPSETDGGIIAVAGGLPRTSGGFDPSGSDGIYEFDQQGRQVAGPVATEGTYSTVGDPEYVSHFRVAPDNSNVAWTDTSSFTSPFTAWRKPNGTGTFTTANDSDDAPLPYSSPEWWGPGHLLITHDGAQLSGHAEYALYSLADGSSPGWTNDAAIGNSPSYQLAISRDGLEFAVMTDDGPDYGGTIHNIAITLETTTTEPANAPVIDTGCTITLPAGEFATSHGSSLASMSFSSDGSTLAWGQDDGTYEANVSDPSNCASVTGSVHLVVPGGEMPFLGDAALSPPSQKTGPGPGPGPAPQPACCAVKAPNTALTSVRMNKRSRTATFKFRGSGGSGRLTFRCRLDRRRWTGCHSPQAYKHLKKGRHTFQVTAVDHRGKADPTPATRRFSV
jgi:hypothetical protein